MLFSYLNDKIFSHELKVLNYDGLWKTKNYRKKFDVSIGLTD